MPQRYVNSAKPWFAWRPVKLSNGKWAWMRTVTKENCTDMAGFFYLGSYNLYHEPTIETQS